MALVSGLAVRTGRGGTAGYLLEVGPRAKGASHPCEDAYLLGGIVFECANCLVECLGCYRVNGIFAVWAVDRKGCNAIWGGVVKYTVAGHGSGFFRSGMVCCKGYPDHEMMQEGMLGTSACGMAFIVGHISRSV